MHTYIKKLIPFLATKRLKIFQGFLEKSYFTMKQDIPYLTS